MSDRCFYCKGPLNDGRLGVTRSGGIELTSGDGWVHRDDSECREYLLEELKRYKKFHDCNICGTMEEKYSVCPKCGPGTGF